MTSDSTPEETGSSHDSFPERTGRPESSESASSWQAAPTNGKSKTLVKKSAKRHGDESVPPRLSPTMVVNSVWEDLVEIEQQIVDPGNPDKQHPKGAKGGWSRLKHWLRTEISPAGFVLRDPRRTFDAVTPLAWIRESGKKNGWTKDFEKSFLLILQAAAQLARTDGRLFHDDHVREKELKRTIRQLADDKKLRPWGAILEDLRAGKVGRKHAHRCELGIECDNAHIGILRADWNADAAHVGIDFSTPMCHLDVRLMNQTIFRTPWETRIFIDGDEFSTSQPWENIGWNADEFGQYIEMKQEVAEGVTVERVIYVPRRTNMILLLDVLRASSASKTRIEWNLASPTVNAINPLGETRARQAEGVDFDLRFLPVAGSTGELEPSGQVIRMADGKLHASAEQNGAAVALPVVLVWDKKTQGEQRLWRPLTVTTDRKLVPTHEALAVRVPVADKQVILFRSLVGTRRFAFIGHQTFYETIVGDIDSAGKLTDWLAVDADPDTPWFYSAEE